MFEPKKRVLHLVSWYPSKQDASLGNFVAEHILAIQKKEAGVILGAFPSAESRIDFQIENEIPVCRVYFRKRAPFLSYLLALKRGADLLMQKGYCFKIIHLHVAYPAGLFTLFFFRNLPLIITEHFSAYQESRRNDLSWANRFFAKIIFNRANYIAPVTKQLGDSLRQFGINSPQRVIGNVVNTQIFNYQTVEKPEIFTILHISSLQESTKNISGIVRAFADLQLKNPSFQLRIGGDGDPSALSDSLKKSGLKREAYHILTTLSKQEVAMEMRKAHCFLLFSHIENEPVVLLESLCCGTPVIATQVGGIPQFIDSDRGILIEPRNEAALQEALLQMRTNYARYQAEKMAIKAQNEFGYEAISEKFSRLYLNVLRSNASSL